jgi:hypothetical protein
MDVEELARLYVRERLSAAEVGQRIGCSETTVRRRLHAHGTDVRSPGPRLRAPTSDGWTRERAYAIGLLATDGNLSKDGRHLNVTSADQDLLVVLQACLGLKANVRQVGPGRCYRIQWSDRRFYEWVESIGLSPSKSRTMGALAVPDEYFADFARGCIDGDGSIVVYVDRYHFDKNPRYVYERLYVTLVSASRPFVEWFRTSLLRLVGIHGSMSERISRSGRPYWVLRYARRESGRLLPWIYYAPSIPCLARKRARSEPFLRVPRTS